MTAVAASNQRSIAQRLSPLIAAFGVACVPGLLTQYQRRLGLTNNEVVYLLHVFKHRWDGDAWPWVSVAEIHEANGAGERSIRDWRASLVKKGYLVLRRRENSGRGRAVYEHDLSGLFAALEALALEPTPRRAALEARQQLPEPTFYMGLPAVPDADVVCRQRRPGLRTKRVQAKALRDLHPAETGRARPAITMPVSSTNPVFAMPVSSTNSSHLFKEAVLKKPLPPTPKGGGGDLASQDDEANTPRDLVVAFYARLNRDVASLDPDILRQEQRAAARLLARGASASEGRRYIGDLVQQPGRWAVPTLRLYDREREGWLARTNPGSFFAISRSAYQHDPWAGQHPPISDADLARGI